MWIEEKFINQAGTVLRNFKKVASNRYQCSCPVCGDSKKFRNKARGSFYVWKSSWLYHCFNCGVTYGVPFFLKQHFEDLYKQYLMESLQDNKPHVVDNQPTKQERVKKFNRKSIEISDAKKVVDLPSNHMAASYVRDRLIPAKYHSELLFVSAFKEWTNLLLPNKFENIKDDEPRLIIPFRNESGEIFAYQGRSFDPNAYAKYITIKLDPEAPKVFGMDRVDPDKTVYIVEGPIDSMFVYNGVADAAGDLKTPGRMYTDSVKVFDNEPRNINTVERIEDAVQDGDRVVIWPEQIEQKDINDMVLFQVNNGASVQQAIDNINQILRDNTIQGLQAELKLAQWRKT